MWTYWWYGSPDGPCPWHTWYDGQNTGVQGKHDSVFRFLESRERWGEPHTKKFTGEALVEVILKGKVQHRLFGFYWPSTIRHSFTFVGTATHKGKVYDPKDAIETTRRRISEIQNGIVRIRRCVRPK